MQRYSRHTPWLGGLLVGVFVLGGVLAPALHVVQDGLAWAATQAGAETCDHSAHGATVENDHADAELDLCPLCLHRWKAAVDPLALQPAFAVRDEHFSPTHLSQETAAPRHYGARAPPPAA
ncbi:MAG: hypothetical protein R3247_06295 [Rhodothermales bacterium]|nr:hypothetical protein [Rhodothermales bacterium]